MRNHLLAGAALAILSSTAAHAQVITFNDLNLADRQWPVVDYFYDGGRTAGRSGPSLGVTFEENAWHVLQGFEPNPSTFVITMDSTSWISARNGFTGQIQFRYGGYEDATFSVYSGLDGTGTLLAQTALPTNVSFGADPGAWSLTTIGFSGEAHSVVISSTAGAFGIDDIRFGANAVPEPASWALMIGGFGLAGAALRRRPQLRVRYAA